MSNQNLSVPEKLAHYFLDVRKVFKIRGNNVYIGNKSYGSKKFKESNETNKHAEGAGVPEFMDLTAPERKIILDKALNIAEDILHQEALDSAEEEEAEWDLGIVEIPWRDYRPIQDLESKDIMMIDKTKQIVSYNYDVWLSTVDEELKWKYIKDIPKVVLQYDPYDISSFTTVPYASGSATRVNLYNAPEWRKLEDPKKPCPARFKKFFQHLFPALEDRIHVIDWMKIAMLDRCESYLVLNGAKGIGKNLFTDICGALVGPEHYSLAPASLLSGTFNSVLDKNRLILLDELKVDKAAHTKLKRYINEDQSIEKKGFDADKSTKTYNSFIVANNDLVDMHIETDDRRFSVPDLTDVLLHNAFDQEFIDALVADIKDPEVIREFGYFVYNFDSDTGHTPFSVRKGKRFWELAYTSLYEWQKFIVDKILSKEDESYMVTMLARQFNDETSYSSRFPRNMDKIKDFIASYLHMGTDRIGHMSRVDGIWYIIPDAEFAPEQNDDTMDHDDIEGLL